MPTASGDFELTMDMLRVVARYVAEAEQDVLPVFEDAVPDDPRPRAAIDAARLFLDSAKRIRLQRTTSLDAHRAAKDARTGMSCFARRRDAAAVAYLHPISRAHHVGHILRAAASSARIAELSAGDDPADGSTGQGIERPGPTETIDEKGASTMNQRTSIRMDVHARSMVARGLDGRTGQLFEHRLTPAPHDLRDWIHTPRTRNGDVRSRARGF